MLVASMNPCRCGYRGSRANDCRCDDTTVAKYVAKLSGPLLDRIDSHVTVARVSFEEMVGAEAVESSDTIRGRIEAARDTQRRRLERYAIACNAEIAAADVRTVCGLDGGSLELLHAAMTRGSVGARAFDRIARVARTMADLDRAAESAVRTLPKRCSTARSTGRAERNKRQDGNKQSKSREVRRSLFMMFRLHGVAYNASDKDSWPTGELRNWTRASAL
jgi:predicted ATPase with chaperone activity